MIWYRHCSRCGPLQFFNLAGRQGFEPRSKVLETPMLPDCTNGPLFGGSTYVKCFRLTDDHLVILRGPAVCFILNYLSSVLRGNFDIDSLTISPKRESFWIRTLEIKNSCSGLFLESYTRVLGVLFAISPAKNI